MPKVRERQSRYMGRFTKIGSDSLALARCEMPTLAELLHGSTMAINTVLELKGAPAALYGGFVAELVSPERTTTTRTTARTIAFWARDRIADNFEVFDFTLSDDEMKRIAALKRPNGRIATPVERVSGGWD